MVSNVLDFNKKSSREAKRRLESTTVKLPKSYTVICKVARDGTLEYSIPNETIASTLLGRELLFDHLNQIIDHMTLDDPGLLYDPYIEEED